MAQSTYPKQWATIFALLYGSKFISPNSFKALLSKILGKDWEIEEVPLSYTEKTSGVTKNGVIANGKWKGRDTLSKGPIITVIKWNIRKANHTVVSDMDLGKIRNDYRVSIIPLLNKLGIASEYMTARIYLTPFDSSVDKGVPKLPAIPMEPKPPVPVPIPKPKPKPKPVPKPLPPPIPQPIPIKVRNLNWMYWVGGGVLGYLVLKNASKRGPMVYA